MADAPKETPTFETDEVKANLSIEAGQGVGARELAAQREAGEKAFEDENEDDVAADFSDGRAEVKDV